VLGQGSCCEPSVWPLCSDLMISSECIDYLVPHPPVVLLQSICTIMLAQLQPLGQWHSSTAKDKGKDPLTVLLPPEVKEARVKGGPTMALRTPCRPAIQVTFP
jgi:hypothetical protein